jgi:hypothetical protein
VEISGQRRDATRGTDRAGRARLYWDTRLHKAPILADSGSLLPGRDPAASAQGAHASPNSFEILRRSGATAPFLAPIGIDDRGRAIWVDLRNPSSTHLLIEGGTPSARGEMLRAIAIGLAATTRPALLQITAIDVSGRDLMVLESLPHAVTETAVDPRSAQAGLLWLDAELRARGSEGRRWPEMLLVVEDVTSLGERECGRSRAALTKILRSGGAWGIHVLGAASVRTAGLRAAGWSGPEVARLTACDFQGLFEYRCGGRRTRLAGVGLAVADLDEVARGGRPASSVLGRRLPTQPTSAGWRPNA